jgi:hypothetical protein
MHRPAELSQPLTAYVDRSTHCATCLMTAAARWTRSRREALVRSGLARPMKAAVREAATGGRHASEASWIRERRRTSPPSMRNLAVDWRICTRPPAFSYTWPRPRRPPARRPHRPLLSPALRPAAVPRLMTEHGMPDVADSAQRRSLRTPLAHLLLARNRTLATCSFVATRALQASDASDRKQMSSARLPQLARPIR